MLRGGQCNSIYMYSLDKAPLDEESPRSRHWVQPTGGLLLKMNPTWGPPRRP